MRELTGHLIDVHGFGRMSYLGVRDIAEFVERYAGFRDALSAAGLPAPEPTHSHPADEASTAAAVMGHLRADALPDVFVCATDQEALVAIDTLAAAGIGVPAQVAVTGFDGILAGRLATPRLTTVRQPMEEIGRTAVRILAGILDGSAGSGPPYPDLSSTFLPGASCGC